VPVLYVFPFFGKKEPALTVLERVEIFSSLLTG